LGDCVLETNVLGDAEGKCGDKKNERGDDAIDDETRELELMRAALIPGNDDDRVTDALALLLDRCFLRYYRLTSWGLPYS
jgi:hypothetical protein